MRSARMWRLVALLAVFAMLAVACSRTPPAGEVSIGEGPGEGRGSAAPGAGEVGAGGGFGTDGSDGSGGSGTTTTTGGGTAGGTTTGSSASGGEVGTTGGTSGGTTGTTGGSTGGTTSGGSDGSDGGSDGSDGGSDGSDGGSDGSEASGPGIEGDTIEIVFHGHFEDCPEDDNEPSDDVRQKGKRVIHEYVKFFNEYVLAHHGWKFEETIVDDGGYFCPERQRAAALKIAKEIQPFATLGSSSSAQGPIVADVVTRAGIIHAGTSWQLSADERARHPYAWNLFTTEEKAYEFFTGWLDERIKGTQVEDRVNGTGLMVDRVYGVLGVDTPLGRTMTKRVRDAMEQAGMPVSGIYLVSPDTGVASQQAPNLVAKMRDDGVNSLLFGVGQTAENGGWNLPFTEAMNQQNYLPDVLVGGTPFGNAFFTQLYNKRVWEHVKGTSPFPSIGLRVAVEQRDGRLQPKEDFDAIKENGDAYTEAWHEKLGHSDNPQDSSYPPAFGTWSQLSFLAAGIINAGDTLTPQTFADAIESAGAPNTPNRCDVDRFMGRDYRFVARYEWNAEHEGGAEGFTTIYWVNEQKDITTGYYESYDNYVYYTSPDQLSPEPSRDTGEEGYDIPKQERIGIKPWKSCSQFPDYPAYRPAG